MIELTSTFISIVAVFIGGVAGTVLTYLATKQRISSEASVASNKLINDAIMAREKILSEQTSALQEQQSRYILDLQAQAATVTLRLQDVDTKLQAAQIAIIAAFQEKSDLTAALKAKATELATAHLDLAEARSKLRDAFAANQILLDRLEQRGKVS